MPMDFVDIKSLERAAQVWKFRKINEKETEIQYRNALADFVASRDFIESEEIRNGCGWDKWTEDQKRAMLGRKLLNN